MSPQIVAGLLALPSEIILDICDRLPCLMDALHLSSTCSSLRFRLAQHVFRRLHISNVAGQCDSALLAAQKYGVHTKELFFKFYSNLPGVDLVVRRHVWPQNTMLPRAAALLLHGAMLPSLSTVRVEFDWEYTDWGSGFDLALARSVHKGCVAILVSLPALAETQPAEKLWSSVACMNQLWAMLMGNRRIDKLVIRHMLPIWTSALATPEFRAFLRRLSCIDFSFWTYRGKDMIEAPERLDSLREVCRQTAELGVALFTNASNLKSLTLQSSDAAPPGFEPSMHVPFLLRKDHLPALEELVLVKYYLNTNLAQFLTAGPESRGPLSRLRLIDCFSARRRRTDPQPDELTWAEFFGCIAEAPPRLLSRVDIEYTSSRMERLTASCNVASRRVYQPVRFADCRRMLDRGPHLQVFTYADVGGGLVSLHNYMRADLTAQAFLQGDDQRAYDDMVAVVAENAARRDQGCAPRNEQNR